MISVVGLIALASVGSTIASTTVVTKGPNRNGAGNLTSFAARPATRITAAMPTNPTMLQRSSAATRPGLVSRVPSALSTTGIDSTTMVRRRYCDSAT